MSQAKAFALLGLFGLMAAATRADAQSVRALDDQRVAVHARDVPLGQLLDELSALAPMDVTLTDPALAQHPVDVVLDDVPLAQAAARALLETGLSFAVGGLKGKPLRVIVGSFDLAAMTPPAATDGDQGSAVSGFLTEQGSLTIKRVEPAPPTGPVEPPQPGMMGSGQRAPASDSSAADPEPVSDAVTEVPVYVPASGQAPGFTMVGESVTFDDPTFVPYKNTVAARAARESVDVSKIP